MQAIDFVRKWGPGGPAAALTERAGAQPHFIDLCRVLGVPEPDDPESYCFERGLTQTGGASGRTDGWADVWKRGAFAWESKAPGRDLGKAPAQLMRYALPLESPLLLEAHYGRPRADTEVYGANFVSDESKVCGILGGQSREQVYDDEPEIDEVPCGWHELRAEVRAAIGPALPVGHRVYRVPAADSRGRRGIEWWWVDDAGELVEAFWFDPR